MRGINLTLLASLLVLMSCGRGKDETSRASIKDIDDLTTRQHAVQGKTIYDNLCANCHQVDGTGLGRLIPPLLDSDYMNADLGRTVRLIKYGIDGEMTVNGISYNQPMPANPTLTPPEIAQIVTYIYNVWGNQTRRITADEVREHLKN